MRGRRHRLIADKLHYLEAVIVIAILVGCADTRTCNILPTEHRIVYGGDPCQFNEMMVSVDFNLSAVTCAKVQVNCPKE